MHPFENVKLKKLRVFIEIAEGRNPLYVVNVKERTVSRYIEELEKLCGQALFEGWRVPINLTLAGRDMLRTAKTIINATDKLYVKLNK